MTRPTFENFEEFFEPGRQSRGYVGRVLARSYPFVDWIENTVIVFAGSLAVTLVLSILAGYALGRLRPPGHRWWWRRLFAAYVVPRTILFFPLYQVVIRFGVDDERKGVGPRRLPGRPARGARAWSLGSS